jgi:quercetin dioxygenase-like cupin family protein
MQILPPGGRPARDVRDWGSSGVRARYLARGAAVRVVQLEFAPGGRLGRHPAGSPQLFAVVSGAGWVAAADGHRRPVAAGDAVLWERGEAHESGAGGAAMIAVVVQAEGLAPVDVAD